MAATIVAGLFAPVWSAHAAAVAESASRPSRHRHHHQHNDAGAWVTLDADTMVTPDTHAESSAAFHQLPREEILPAWRWYEPKELRRVETVLATDLIVSVSTEPDPSGGGENAWTAAGETIARAFALSPAGSLSGRDAALPGDSQAQHDQTGPDIPEAAGAGLTPGGDDLLVGWQEGLKAAIDQAAQELVRIASEHPAKSVRISAVVPRQRLVAECRAVELLDGEDWVFGGWRPVAQRRIRTAPARFEGEPIALDDPAIAPAAARAAVTALARWLGENYARGASIAAQLGLTGQIPGPPPSRQGSPASNESSENPTDRAANSPGS